MLRTRELTSKDCVISTRRPRDWLPELHKRKYGLFRGLLATRIVQCANQTSLWVLGLHNAPFQLVRAAGPRTCTIFWASSRCLSELCKARLEGSHWPKLCVFWEVCRAFPLKIVQCCLGEVESGPRLPRPADAQLKANEDVNAWC